MTTQLQGQFIVVEGMDGSGKSMATDVLSEALRQLGKDVVQTYEVGGTPIGKDLRNLCFRSRKDDEVVDPVARMLMIYAARMQHLTNIVYPAIALGKTVVTDRYVPSSRVYQGALDGLNSIMDELDRVEGLRVLAQKADVYVYLDVDPNVAYQRGVARENVDNDVYKNDIAKAYKIRDAYDALFSSYHGLTGTRVIRIDANQPLLEVQKSLIYAAQDIILHSRMMPPLNGEVVGQQAPSGNGPKWNAHQLPLSAAMAARL